jgi:tRNA(Ser,Leu) C12 N-acetylase TAN1
MPQQSGPNVMAASKDADAPLEGTAREGWNAVISVYQDGFRRAIRELRKLGPVERSPYHNVLVMTARDPADLLETIERRCEADPALCDAISRVAPAMRTFEFHSAAEFLAEARKAVIGWLPELAGRSFHIRLHRRGLKHDLNSADAERELGGILIDALKAAGTPGSLSFSDPDAVIAIDTLGERAGVGLWTRQDLARHRLLRPD